MNKKTFLKAVVVLAFLIAMLGKGDQVIAQDFSNPVITTNCCLDFKKLVDSVMKYAPFVFEGRMIKRYNDNCYLFEIEKVYRGKKQLQAGTIEIIGKDYLYWMEYDIGERIDGRFYRRENIDTIVNNTWYIIFAKETDAQGAFDANNSTKLEFFYIDASSASAFREITPTRCCKGQMIFDPTYYSYSNAERTLDFKTQKEVRDFLRIYKLFPKDISKKADILKILTYKEKAIRDAEEVTKRAEEDK